jgi:hypothetical protein
VEALRKKLQAESERNKNKKTDARGLKSHQIHDLAKAKIEETEKLRTALGISKDYEEGDHWRKQEERLKAALEKKQKEAEEQERSDEDEDDD